MGGIGLGEKKWEGRGVDGGGVGGGRAEIVTGKKGAFPRTVLLPERHMQFSAMYVAASREVGRAYAA